MSAECQLLLADDDSQLTDLLRIYLETEGFDVRVANDGETALAMIRDGEFNLVILDVMMPGRSGFEVLGELRRTNNLPVLMLTARGSDDDRIQGLEMGADDYLTKPFNPRELVARVRAVLRRGTADETDDGWLRQDDLALHSRSRRVTVAGRPVTLTSTEFDLLEALLSTAGQTMSKSALSSAVLERDLGRYDRSIDVHVSHLRSKLGNAADGEPRIVARRGKGYLYRCITGSA